MNLRDSQAMQEALALLQNPRGPRPGPTQPLPDGIRFLLRIVAGDDKALADAQLQSGAEAERIREAASFYIQQVLFASGSDSYRILGADARASSEQLKENYRWLVRWQHPDRNPDEWEAIYADRVNRAWQDLRTEDRRQQYDRNSPTPSALMPATRKIAPSATSRVEFAAAVPNLRWLPGLIFGALAVSAVLAIGLLSALHWVETHPPAVAEEAAELPASARPSPLEIEALVAPPASSKLPVPLAKQSAKPAVVVAPVPSTPAANPTSAPTVDRIAVPTARPAIAKTSPPLPSATTFKSADAARAAPAAKPLPKPAIARTQTIADSAPQTQSETSPNPAPSADPLPTASHAAVAIDDRVANRLLGVFSEIYRDGDLARLERLLTADARSAKGSRDQLVAEYARLFASSDQRSLLVSNVSWLAHGQNGSIIASFEASVNSRRSNHPRRSRGDLRLDVRLDDGQWRIYRLMHEERRG